MKNLRLERMMRAMEFELQTFFGFVHQPKLAGPDGTYTVWQNVAKQSFAEPLEVRLYNNRHFRVVDFSGAELALGIGIRQLRQVLNALEVK